MTSRATSSPGMSSPRSRARTQKRCSSRCRRSTSSSLRSDTNDDRGLAFLQAQERKLHEVVAEGSDPRGDEERHDEQDDRRLVVERGGESEAAGREVAGIALLGEQRDDGEVPEVEGVRHEPEPHERLPPEQAARSAAAEVAEQGRCEDEKAHAEGEDDV